MSFGSLGGKAIESLNLGAKIDNCYRNTGQDGTGPAPLTFADHVGLKGISERVMWIGSGQLGFPDRAIVAMAQGADMINIAREGMLSIGRIQAQKCHTGFYPAGVATQSSSLQKGIKTDIQFVRFQKFCDSLRNEILAVTHACGYEHPSQLKMSDIELSAGPTLFKTLEEIHGYNNGRS